MPLYTEAEMEARERDHIKEIERICTDWSRDYRALLRAANKAAKTLNPGKTCKEFDDHFTGDWSPPESKRCTNPVLLHGRCVLHIRKKNEQPRIVAD